MRDDNEEVDMDLWRERIQQDINDVKQKQNQSDSTLQTVLSEVSKLQVSEKLQDKEIESLKTTLSDIKDDTKFIRRKITGSIITASITAVIGGMIAIAIATIFG